MKCIISIPDASYGLTEITRTRQKLNRKLSYYSHIKRTEIFEANDLLHFPQFSFYYKYVTILVK
jgi:hypothetical protein